MIGSGPARPVLGLSKGKIQFGAPNSSTTGFKGEWGGAKILWAVAPGTGTVTVRGHEVGGEGKLRFGPGMHPKAEIVLAASPRANEWSDFPGYTRAKDPGCYAFEVSSPYGTEQITFRFVEHSGDD